MATLQKQTKRQVIAHVRKHGSWHGLVCANKMYPIIGQTAMYLDLELHDNVVHVEYNEQLQEFNTWLNNWSYYNTSYEEGYYAAFYMLVKG